MGLADLPTLDNDPRPLRPKPARGSARLEREKTRAEAKAAEDEVIKAAKTLDGRCRWPEHHKCRGGLEGAHVFQHRGMGGNPEGDRTTVESILTVCAWIHRQGPESIDGKQLKVEALSPLGTRGPLAFYRETERGWHVVASETAPFIYERD